MYVYYTVLLMETFLLFSEETQTRRLHSGVYESISIT